MAGRRTRRIEEQPLGKRFGKTDLDRVGLFHDPPLAPFDEYRGPVEFCEGANKGRQMLAGPTIKLFEEKFVRIFEGEALAAPWREKAGKSLRDRKPRPYMLPSSPSKKHSTPGDWHGCFDKPPFLDPRPRDESEKQKKKFAREPPNMKIKPNPLGGPGYVDICLSPFPSYSHEPYDRETRGKSERPTLGRFLTVSAPLDYFPPNPHLQKEPGRTYVRPVERTEKMIGTERFCVPFPKKPGGNHDGCFDKFPEYVSDPYVKVVEKFHEKPAFLAGGPAFRSKYTNSIVDQITRRSCNSRNYLTYRERAYPLRE